MSSQTAKDKADKVYISIDIDVLDPGFAPATGTPEPGGFAPIDLLRIVRQLVLETDVVAFDIMEVAPAVRPRRHHREQRAPAHLGVPARPRAAKKTRRRL